MTLRFYSLDARIRAATNATARISTKPIHSGDSTQIQDQVITPTSFSTMKTTVSTENRPRPPELSMSLLSEGNLTGCGQVRIGHRTILLGRLLQHVGRLPTLRSGSLTQPPEHQLAALQALDQA